MLQGNDLIVAKKLMGVYLSQMGATAEAIQYLAELANDQPDLLLTLAVLNRQIGNEPRAKQYATEATAFLRSILSTKPQDIQTRIHLAQAIAINRDWGDGIRVLTEGLKVNPDPRLSEGTWGNICRCQFATGQPSTT